MCTTIYRSHLQIYGIHKSEPARDLLLCNKIQIFTCSKYTIIISNEGLIQI